MLKYIFRLALIFSMTACATRLDISEDGLWASSAWVKTSGVRVDGAPRALPVDEASHWSHYRLPGKSATVFMAIQNDGRAAMQANSDSSASMLRRKVRVAPSDLGVVRFSWKVPDMLARADMSLRDFDDSPVRVVLAFEGDRSQFSAKNALMNELSRAITGEEMPYAVMMYVWSKQHPLGAVINSPRTDRIRKLVVETGTVNLNRWQDYERDIAADFEKLYGEPPGALIGMGIMTDTDNTHTTAQAWYGPLQVLSRSAAKTIP
jgi:hypothetical protein